MPRMRGIRGPGFINAVYFLLNKHKGRTWTFHAWIYLFLETRAMIRWNGVCEVCLGGNLHCTISFHGLHEFNFIWYRSGRARFWYALSYVIGLCSVLVGSIGKQLNRRSVWLNLMSSVHICSLSVLLGLLYCTEKKSYIFHVNKTEN